MNYIEDHKTNRSDYISVTNHVVADPHELMLSRIQFTADLERKNRQCQEHGKENTVYLKDDLAPRLTQEPPSDGRGVYNQFYQSPSITSNTIFYRDFKGNKRPT